MEEQSLWLKGLLRNLERDSVTRVLSSPLCDSRCYVSCSCFPQSRDGYLCQKDVKRGQAPRGRIIDEATGTRVGNLINFRSTLHD